eukprot:6206690-Pleurochrysis_carterae.AAC.3
MTSRAWSFVLSRRRLDNLRISCNLERSLASYARSPRKASFLCRLVSLQKLADEGSPGDADAAGLPMVGVRCRVRRPRSVFCLCCRRLSACARCVAAGRLHWHRHECAPFQARARIGRRG